MSSALATIEKSIKTNLIMIFSKTYCPYCNRVKDLFRTLAVPFTSMELDELPDGEQYQDELQVKTGSRSVPRVFIKGNFIGGCDDTFALHKKGELIPKLIEAGLSPKL